MLVRTVTVVVESEEGDTVIDGTPENMARQALAHIQKESSFWAVDRVQIISNPTRGGTIVSVHARDPRAPARDDERQAKISREA